MPEDSEATGDGYPDPPVAVDHVAPATLADRLDAGDPVRLLDVRDRDEVEAWRIDGPSVTRTHLPYAKFLQAKVTDTVDDLAASVAGEGPILTVCAEGAASDFVAGLLVAAGHEARNLADGMAGWARVYQAATVRESPTVLQYRRPSSGCLAYLLVAGEEAVVVDPLRQFVDRYEADAAARDADIVAAVDTHVHADHVSGLCDLAAATDATPVMPADAVARGVTDDVETLRDGDEFTVGDATVRALALPGHTTGMMGLAVADVLLTGDSLFVDSVARPDLQDGAAGARELAGQLYETLTDRLAAVPDDTVVAPGHYEDASAVGADGTVTARLGDLRDALPYFGLDRAAFVDRLAGDLPPQPANFETIVAVNLGRERADDETAFELELGPNNCAAGGVEAD